MVIKNLFNENVNTTKKVDYMIDLHYGQKDWDMSSALREIIANAIDTKTEYSYSWKDGIATIKDNGPGLPKRAFVMGSSSKSSDASSIGQFGEGLKMCLVTALRYGKKVSIRTVGYGVETESVHSDEYGTDMMRIYFTDGNISNGTEIKVECDKDSYDKALEMFLQLRNGYKLLDKNLYLPGGYISILGLTTEERPNMLFSYDLNDKSLTNRDRNVIKTRKLKDEMNKILSGIKKKEAVEEYIKGLSENPESEEYKIAFEPKNKRIWKDTVDKLFGNQVVFSSSSDGDVKAVYKGYKVIPCPTKQVRTVLSSVGVKSSAQKTKAMKNDKVLIKDETENKITYPIARSYVENWTVNQAGRELMANALDMSQNATIRYENGRCIIEDSGAGIERKHFVIGNSNKSEDQIGVFGEGFKMASLVLARENRNMILDTVGYTYKPALEMSKEFATEIFCFHYEANTKKKGTVISFDASEKETEDIKSLFICFNENTNFIDKTDVVDVIDDDNGAIYVNGLLSCQIKSLFSYNIKGNKEIVDSRDRNHVDESKLSQIIKEYCDSTSNTDVIDKILSGWEKDPYYKEYSLVLEPNMPMFWYAEVDKIYPDTCIFSTVSEKSNFIAETAGYKVLRNVPSYIMAVLSHILKSADEIAREYGDDGILLGDQIVFPITDGYMPKWNDADALKELLSNAIDASHNDASKVSLDWKDGAFVIEDKGSGLKRENLLIGNSDSRSVGTAIGTFGEGLKLAALKLSSSGRNVTIETVGFTVTSKIERVAKFSSNLLVMKLKENDRTAGTRITGSCEESSFVSAKNMFIGFDKDKVEIESGLYKGGKSGVYVNGALVYNINSIGYSYNFTSPYAKASLTRDRNSFSDHGFVHSNVISILSEIRDTDIIKDIIERIDNSSEEAVAVKTCGYLFNSTAKKRWKKIAIEMYPDSCLPSDYDAQATLVATDVNIKILNNLPEGKRALLSVIGFPKAEEAIALKSAREKRETVIPVNKLTEEERKQYNIITNMVSKEFGVSMPSKIKIVACLDDKPGLMKTFGMYHSATDTIFIIRELLSSPLSVALGVVDHEFEHRKYGHSDRTREFENDLTNRIGSILERTYHA